MYKKKHKLLIRQPLSIREKVYTAIKNDILNGHIPLGGRVVETRLAKEIKTSRMPVREAMHMLEMEGLLEAIPRVGYRVKPLEWDEFEEICEIRAVNETLAARWAIKRITPKELRALEENITVAETEAKKWNQRSFVERDAEFHEILAIASGSKRLLELCQLLCRHMLRYRLEASYHPEPALVAIEGHRRILACVKEKDEEGVESAIKEHLERSKLCVQQYVFGGEYENKELGEGGK